MCLCFKPENRVYKQSSGSHLSKTSLHFLVWKWLLADPDQEFRVVNLRRHKSTHIQITNQIHPEATEPHLSKLGSQLSEVLTLSSLSSLLTPPPKPRLLPRAPGNSLDSFQTRSALRRTSANVGRSSNMESNRAEISINVIFSRQIGSLMAGLAGCTKSPWRALKASYIP